MFPFWYYANTQSSLSFLICVFVCIFLKRKRIFFSIPVCQFLLKNFYYMFATEWKRRHHLDTAVLFPIVVTISIPSSFDYPPGRCGALRSCATNRSASRNPYRCCLCGLDSVSLSNVNIALNRERERERRLIIDCKRDWEKRVALTFGQPRLLTQQTRAEWSLSHSDRRPLDSIEKSITLLSL